MATWSINREGFFFRAVSEAGARSSLFTSASQAGLFIQRKAGNVACASAVEAFLAAQRVEAA